MVIRKEDLLKLVNLKKEVFEVPSWKSEVIVRELTIAEATIYYQMIKENKPLEEIVKYACRCTMIEPEMFTDEELLKINQDGYNGLNEIFSNIPVIGKTKEEKEDFFKKQIETFKASQEKKPELIKEEEAKK